MQAARPRRPLRAAAAGLLPALLVSLPSIAAAFWSSPDASAFRPDYRPAARVSCRLDSPLPRPLIDAAGCGDVERVRARLAEGGDIGAVDPRPGLAGRTALHHAVQRGDLAAVELLLAAGAVPNVIDRGGDTPLHLLVRRDARAGDDTIARKLVEAGADARLRNARARTPLAELIAHESLGVQPLRVAPSALAALLDEAEAAGPRPVAVTAPVPAPPQPAAPSDAAAIAWTPGPIAGLAQASLSGAPAAAASAEAAPAQAADDPVAAIRGTLESWASAWSAGDVQRYLSHYSNDFHPAGGKSRAEWRAQREQRIGKTSGIQVRLADVEVSVDGDRAAAKFVQDYRSASLKAVDRKLVTLVRDGQEWRILEESTAR